MICRHTAKRCVPLRRGVAFGVAVGVAVVALLLPGCAVDIVEDPGINLDSLQISFEGVPVGHRQSFTIAVWNDGESFLRIGEIEIVNASNEPPTGFSFSSALLEMTEQGLGPGEGGWILVDFAPELDGSDNAELLITSNDPNQPVSIVKLKGTALSAQIAVSPASPIDFGTAPLGEMVFEEIVVWNVGAAPLTIHEVGLADPGDAFWIQMINVLPGATLKVDESATLIIGYMPAVSQESSNTLVVLSSDPAEPRTEIVILGGAAESSPECGILSPQESVVYDGERLSLAATAIDGQTDSQNLIVVWTDTTAQTSEVIFVGAPDAIGYVEHEYAISTPGNHVLEMEATDDAGLSCWASVNVQVLEDLAPEVLITAPAGPTILEDGNCLDLNGVVGDERDGDVLEVSWWSDHPDAPAPLLQGWSDESGIASHIVCDLPCGTQNLQLLAVDSVGQSGSDSVTLDVTLADPILDYVADQTIVLGQTLEMNFTAQDSCRTSPTITASGLPQNAVLTADGFIYTPLFDHLVNPVGVSVQVDLHAEITFDATTRVDDQSFTLTVVSDEYLALSGEHVGEVRILYSDYGGGWSGPDVLNLAIQMDPVAIADFNGDGSQDLLMVDSLQGGWLWLRRQDGGFDEVQLSMFIDGPVSVGDFDGDGLSDLVVLDALLGGTTYLNVTDVAVPESPDFDAIPGSLNLALLGEVGGVEVAASSVDHDGDGLDDLTVSFFGAEESSFYRVPAAPAADGTFDAPVAWFYGEPTRSIAQGTYGLDAINDLLIGGAEFADPGQTYLLNGDGSLGFDGPMLAWDANPQQEAGWGEDAAAGESDYAPLDVNHDGCLDVVVAFISYLDPFGANSDLSIGTLTQRVGPGAGDCEGTFGTGSGEDLPNVFLIELDSTHVVVPHVP